MMNKATSIFSRLTLVVLFQVVYGDTDSMFVVAPGATRAEAFLIGQQIADAVTADNPSPVALKLEKVRIYSDIPGGLELPPSTDVLRRL